MPEFPALPHLLADLAAQQRPAPAQDEHLRQQEQLDWSYRAETLRGNALTLPETRALLLHGLTAAAKPLHDHLALEATHSAVQQLAGWVRGGAALTPTNLHRLHAALLGLPPGTESPYKTTSNNLLTEHGSTRYFSTPEAPPARVADLLAWLRRELAAPTLPPVALAAQLHHRLGRVRPFGAGNGRLARLLLGGVLLRHGYPAPIIKAEEYARYRAACAAADAGEPEPFLTFLTERVAAAVRRRLRGLRGEAVDEAEELHARVAQLKQLLLGQEDAVQQLWNAEAQATIYEALVGPWLRDAIRQTRDFDDLFMSRDYAGSLDVPPATAVRLEAEGDLEAFQGQFRTAIAGTTAALEGIHFAKRWLHFRQRHNGFDLLLQVSFWFRPDHLIVRQSLASSHGPAAPTPLWEAEVFSASYLPTYDHARLHEINQQLALKVYDFLATQLPATATSLP